MNNLESLIDYLKTNGFEIRIRNYKYLNNSRSEYIATDGNVWLYFESICGNYIPIAAFDAEITNVPIERGIVDEVFYRDTYRYQKIRSNRICLFRRDYTVEGIIEEINRYKNIYI